MKKNKRLCILLTLYFSIGQIDAQTPLSFEESLHLLNQGNQSLKIADKSIEIAKAERDKLNAFWYPSLQSTGAFVHMSEKIEVKQPLSQFTDPAKDFVHSIIPDDQIIWLIRHGKMIFFTPCFDIEHDTVHLRCRNFRL